MDPGCALPQAALIPVLCGLTGFDQLIPSQQANTVAIGHECLVYNHVNFAFCLSLAVGD